MQDDLIFRNILLLGILITLPIGLYHRIKSQATGEKLDRRQEGLFILVSLRFLGGLVFVGLVAYLIDPVWMEWSSVPLPKWLRWFGVGLGAVSALLLTWTFRSLGKNLTDTVVTRIEHTLVTTGPYRWVRHPFYVATFIGFLAVSSMASNWYFAVVGGMAVTLLFIRTQTEEQKLIERFGNDYRRYMKRTGRFIPRLRHATSSRWSGG